MSSWEELKTQGGVHYQAGEWMKAVACFTKAIKLAPDNETLYANRCAALCELNKASKAIADGEKCVSLKPEWAKAHYRLGKAYLIGAKGADAVTSLEKALSLDPTMEDIEEFNQVLKEARLATWNMANPGGLRVIGNEKDYDAADKEGSVAKADPLAFAAQAIEAVTESFTVAGQADACAYFPGGSVVGIGKAFEGKDIHGPIAQCTGFLREHAASLKANCVCVAVQKSRISYPRSWERQTKKVWRFKEQDGVFIQLETDDVNLRRVWFLPAHKGKLMDAVMLDENMMTIMPSVFHDEARFNDDGNDLNDASNGAGAEIEA